MKNFLKDYVHGLNDIVFWYKLLKRKIWGETYYLSFGTFLEDCMVLTLLYFDKNLFKKTISVEMFGVSSKIFKIDKIGSTVYSFDRKISKRLYALNCIMSWSKFS